MFYHTVVLESGDVVIALEADSNRSPLEKGHAIRRADRDGLLSGCPANSKMTVGPLVRTASLSPPTEVAISAAPEQTTGNSIGWQVLVGAAIAACELSRDRAQFARVFPPSRRTRSAHGTGEPGQQRPPLRELAHAPSI